jgi:hypothetical protein
MKKIILTFLMLLTSFWSCSLFSQVDNEVVALGLPGDNLNLYAVLDVFEKSKTLEEFERVLNSGDSRINNLDLNNDNEVDYISVISFNQGRFYSIVLRDSINNMEFQDVAVIEVSKNNAGNVIVQIIGDEALYGKDYVVEPSVREVFETPNPGYIGNKTIIINNRVYGNSIVYVADWPLIAYLFSPSFSIYVSPWHWGYYPVYWNPWRPILYFNYWSYHNHYYSSSRYRRTSYIRFPSHHSYYLQRRTASSIVTRNRNSGTYRSTYGGQVFRQPVAPPRVLRRDIRRENRESTRQQVQPSTRTQNRTSTRQENQRSPREQARPTAPQNKTSTRQQTSQPSISPQVRPWNSQRTPSSARQMDRQIRQTARQSAREARQSNRVDRRKTRP